MLHFNKTSLEEVQRERLSELIEFTEGNYPFLAKMLDVPVGTVQGWLSRGRISKSGALLVEKNDALNKNFTAVYLRPDIK